MLKYINWNIKCYCQIDRVVSFLKTRMSASRCVVALQEVLPEKAGRIKAEFTNDYSVIYSLDYHPSNDAFDTDNRRLGVLFLISNDIRVEEAGVFERCLFPERTLFASVIIDGTKRRIVNFHSITGVSFKMGKAVQYRRFAESINAYKPDIISMDANEPEVDHYLPDKREFFDQGDDGKGAKVFFDELLKQNLVDAYVKVYDVSEFENGEPLAVSHVINGKIRRRYDLIFTKEDIDIWSVKYIYKEACEASSDHAMVVAEMKM